MSAEPAKCKLPYSQIFILGKQINILRQSNIFPYDILRKGKQDKQASVGHFAPSFMPPGGYNEISRVTTSEPHDCPPRRMISHPIKKVIGAISQKFR